MTVPLCHGGFADVWKGQHHDREVVAKVLRVYQTSDLGQIRKVGAPRLASRINELTVSHTEVLQGGRGMESPSPSKCAAAVGCYDDRNPVCDGIGMDGERKHQ